MASGTETYYAEAYEDFRSMGLQGAASQVLLEGLAAHADSAPLLELARRDAIEVPMGVRVRFWESQSSSQDGYGAKAPAKGPAVQDLEKALQEFQSAQEAHQKFLEAEASAHSWPELRQRELELRKRAVEAFGRCKPLILERRLEIRPELLRAPLTPDTWPETAAVLHLGDEALRKLLPPGAFDPLLWAKEGPGRLLDQARAMSELDALPARAQQLAQRGPGTLSELLALVAHETAALVSMSDGAKRVLVLGGHGVSGVFAARAGAETSVWEPAADVAAAAREVLRRNLRPEEFERCSVVGELPTGPWSVVAVDRWHGLGVLGVVPSRLRVHVALADASLAAEGFDLSAMDRNFRLAQPLKVAGPASHATALQPKLLTELLPAFDVDLSQLPELDTGSLSFQLGGGSASCAVLECSLEMPSGASSSLRFAQWLPGGVLGPTAAVQVRRNDCRIWVECDSTVRYRHPPFAFMSLSDWYFEMLRDGARHQLYERALQVEIAKVKETSEQCAVLDVGSGDGILSLMALRAGATKGLGVEYVSQIARASQQVIAANRVKNAVPKDVPLEIWCTDVRGVKEMALAERFDLLVTELMDASGLGENLILLTESSKRRLCKADAKVIPAVLRLKAVLCEVRLPDIGGVNMDAFWPFWPVDRTSDALWLGVDLDKGEGDFQILTEPIELFSLELGKADVDAIPTKASYTFPGKAEGMANMVVWWFEAQLSETDPSVVLTNAPTALDGRHSATCWGQAAAELPTHAEVSVGQGTEIVMELAFGDHQLKFRTPSGAGVQDRWAPPPQAAGFSEEYKKVLEGFPARQRRFAEEAKRSPPGLTALRAAEPEPVAALQRCSLALALFPGSFGLEPNAAQRQLAGWYAVGGEGRS
ncbi:unnamed protein product [Effrenium voratum]|uniref:Protein arginine N-methyltransferase domain-containing protein n=1 Tax=Effrenium voratum TaxID=2562239 RepID=A0AA36N577_9DINO|nr:unnamed protein product [Effrenium voratum]